MTMKESCQVWCSLWTRPGGRPKHDGSFMLDLTYLMVFGIFPRLIFLFYTAQVRTWKIVLIPVLDQGIKWQFIKIFHLDSLHLHVQQQKARNLLPLKRHQKKKLFSRFFHFSPRSSLSRWIPAFLMFVFRENKSWTSNWSMLNSWHFDKWHE